MSDKSTAASSGISTNSLVFVLFLALKLTHVIAWSWWWVTAPLWLPFAVVLVVLAAALAITAVTA